MPLASPAATIDALDVVGSAVRTESGEELGRIVAFVRDVHEGPFATLAAGGVLGIAERLFLVPLQAFRAEGERILVLDMPRWRLQDAPGCARGEEFPVHDVAWVRDLHRFYGTSRP